MLRQASAGGEPASYNAPGFYVETSTVGAAGPWTINTVVRTNTPGTNPPVSTALAYSTPVSARYVRFFFNAPSGVDRYARIPEIEIYQQPATVGDWVLY